MPRHPLAPEYLSDPVLLMRPIARAVAGSNAGYSFSLVRRDGESEEYNLHYTDLLVLGDVLRALVADRQLEAIVLRGFCGEGTTAVVHLPSRSFYGEGAGGALGPLFEKLLPADEGARPVDETTLAVWRSRYPSQIELT